MNIGRKFCLTFLALSAVSLAGGAFVCASGASKGCISESFAGEYGRALQLSSAWSGTRAAALRLYAARSQAEADKAASDFAKSSALFKSSAAGTSQILSDSAEKFDHLVSKSLYPALRDGDAQTAESAASGLDTESAKIDEVLGQLSSSERIAALRGEASSKSFIWWFAGFSVLMLLASWLASAILAGGLVKRVRKLEESVKSAGSEGQIDVPAGSAHDELDALAGSVASFASRLGDSRKCSADFEKRIAELTEACRSQVASIVTVTDSVHAQADTVAAASEEMTSTTSNISDNCNSAAKSSAETKDSATKSMDVVRSTVAGIRHHSERTKADADAVTELSAKIQKIGSVVTTIQEIAAQTNLLALNAAIEAARAGEQGRGFAVVADEVRALAGRTDKSTREIDEMIKEVQQGAQDATASMGESVNEMQTVASQAELVEQNLDNVVTKIAEVNDQISQIAEAVNQQTAATAEVSLNIQNISSSVQTITDYARNADRTVESFSRISAETAETAES